MTQENIRGFNNQAYSVAEGSALIKELDDRTAHDVDGYNSIAEIGIKLKKIFGMTHTINDEIFSFKKHPENNDPGNAEVFEAYDYGFNYRRSNEIIWTLFQWTGGDVNDDANFIVHTYLRIEPIPE